MTFYLCFSQRKNAELLCYPTKGDALQTGLQQLLDFFLGI